MHQNQQHLPPSRLYPNSLSGHASFLLLSQTPTIISSPLQNNNNNTPNSNNTSNSTQSPPSGPLARSRPAPGNNNLSAMAGNATEAANINSNLDPRRANNHEQQPVFLNQHNNHPQPVGYINFKKPQNEMFKRLDGKIQKIVAAHSNLNKLYALNEFSTFGAGPTRPFELPPQLPPPPPWVPKVGGNQLLEPPKAPPEMLLHDPRKNLIRKDKEASVDRAHIQKLREEWNIMRLVELQKNRDKVEKRSEARRNKKLNEMGIHEHNSGLDPDKPNTSEFLAQWRKDQPEPCVPRKKALDSVLSRLHQKRKQQQQLPTPTTSTFNSAIASPSFSTASSSKTNSGKIPKITPAQFSMLGQRLKDAIESGRLNKESSTRTFENLPCETRRKIQHDIIALLKREIAAATKSAKLNFTSPPNASNRPREQKSLLLKSSPQTLFNTIRRETSLLLNKQHHPAPSRSSLSLLSDQQTYNRQNAHVNTGLNNRQQAVNRPQTVKVIVPPSSEHHTGLRLVNYYDREPPQPNNEVITIDQFAKCLNLVRSDDAILQKHQERVSEMDLKWKLYYGNRPMRLRRLRGEKIRMPASASYRAARKAGLQ